MLDQRIISVDFEAKRFSTCGTAAERWPPDFGNGSARVEVLFTQRDIPPKQEIGIFGGSRR